MNAINEAPRSPRSPRSPWSQRRAWMLAGLLPVFLLIPAMAAAASDAKAPPQIGGLWKLNEKESESFQKKMEEMRGSGGAGGGHHGGMRGGMGGGGGMGAGGGMGGGRRMRGGNPDAESGGPPDDASSSEARDPSRNPQMRELARPPLMLLIEQADSTLVLSERGETLQVLELGALPTAGQGVQPEASHVPAKWRGELLVSERAGARGGKFSQEFSLSKDGKTLVIRTRRESPGGRPPIELKRVYDRYEGD